ncbi:MAG: hypothetical protein U9N81_08470 [Bacillota bacterium]|nr:hypothetical protein [Bacillota bacterium]
MGEKTLKVIIGSWRPGIPSANVSEIALLPDPADLAKAASVIQQGSCLRNRVKGKLYVSSMTDYNFFVTAMLAGTSATLNDTDVDLSGSYMIESLGEPEYKQSDVIFFEITFVEVG